MFKLLRFYHKLDCKNTDNLASESFPGFLFKCSLFSSNICSFKMDDFQLTFFHFMLNPISVWHKVWKTDEIILRWSCCCKVCKWKTKWKEPPSESCPASPLAFRTWTWVTREGKPHNPDQHVFGGASKVSSLQRTGGRLAQSTNDSR